MPVAPNFQVKKGKEYKYVLSIYAPTKELATTTVMIVDVS